MMVRTGAAVAAVLADMLVLAAKAQWGQPTKQQDKTVLEAAAVVVVEQFNLVPLLVAVAGVAWEYLVKDVTVQVV
jgi:hypothetical protein